MIFLRVECSTKAPKSVVGVALEGSISNCCIREYFNNV